MMNQINTMTDQINILYLRENPAIELVEPGFNLLKIKELELETVKKVGHGNDSKDKLKAQENEDVFRM